MKSILTLSIVFALLFTTRILIPLKTGQKPTLIEQMRPEVPSPSYETSAEQLLDEERFLTVVEQLGEHNNLPSHEVRELLLSTLAIMQSEIPFIFPQQFYSVLCLPEPTSTYEVHQRLHLRDSALGVPIYLDVRVYDAPKEAVLHALFSAIEGKFEEKAREKGVCFVGRGERLFVDNDPTHGFATAQGERGLFFHLVEHQGRVYVAYTESAWDSFIPSAQWEFVKTL